MPRILPFVPSIGAYRFGTTLEGTPYIFDVRWNTRDAAWYFDILEQDETRMASGIKIVLGAYLGRMFSHKLFRDGVFVARPTSSGRRDASFDDLGTRIQVWRFTTDELRAEIIGAALGGARRQP